MRKIISFMHVSLDGFVTGPNGEVDWINFLAEGGGSVARAILSENGKLVEPGDDGQGGQFLVTAFVKAQGDKPWDLWTPTLYETYDLAGQYATVDENLTGYENLDMVGRLYHLGKAMANGWPISALGGRNQ